MSWSDRYNNAAPWVVVALAIVILVPTSVWLGYQLHNEDAYKEYAAAKAHSEAKNEFERRCAVLSIPEEITRCYSDVVQSAREPQRSEEDLQAQKQMANWALALLVVSSVLGLLSLIAAVVGVVLIRDTLVETRRIGEAQIRAYVWTSGADFSIAAYLNGPITCDIRLSLQNTGSTPANIVQFSCTAGIIKSDYTGRLDKFHLIDRIMTQPGTGSQYIPAGGGTYVPTLNKLTADQIAKFTSGDYVAIVLGKIVFNDVFNKRFCVEICIRCEYRAKNNVECSMYPMHNRPQYEIR